MATGSIKSRKEDEERTHLGAYQGTKEERLHQLYDDWYGCEKCLLASFRADDKGPKKDICFAEGNPDAPVMIIGEAPGLEEDITKVPFIGPSGRLLNLILATVSDHPVIKAAFATYNKGRKSNAEKEEFHTIVREWRKQEFFITNVVCCRPPDNRTPTKPEIKACWPRLHNMIDIVDPWLIITSGKAAITTLAKRNIELTKLRGKLVDVEIQGRVTTYKKMVMPTLHPSFLLRTADYKTKNGAYNQTVKDVRSALVYIDNLKNQYFGTPIPDRPALPPT
jgi:DNA polymerase